MSELQTIKHALTPMDLLQAAQERGADIDQLQKLMELQLRWEENEARKSYNRAISSFKSENIRIVKDAVVDFSSQKGRTHYRHATLANVVAQVTEAMSKYSLSHSWSTAQAGELITVTCRVSHVDGHSESVSLSASPDTSGNKNSIQAIASTVTYLERYTLLSSLGLATHDDDGKGAGDEEVDLINDQQYTNLIDLLKRASRTEPQFCAYLKIDALHNLPAKRYAEAVKVLSTKGGK
jgi:hypothetical protein